MNPTAASPNPPDILLSALVWIPAIFAVIVFFLPERAADDRARVRGTALFGSALSFALIFWLVTGEINLGEGGGTFADHEENIAWLKIFGFAMHYHLVADGMTLALLVLSGVIFLAVLLWNYRMQENLKLYCVLVLLLETAINGLLCSYDLLLFLAFWLATIPLVYGLLRGFGPLARVQAAQQYLWAWSLAAIMLVSGAALAISQSGQHSSDMSALISTATNFSGGAGAVGMWLMFLAFAIGAGIIPFHFWLMQVAEHSAPAAVTLVVGVVTKFVPLAMLRLLLGIFPTAATHYSLVFAATAVGVVGWSAAAALRERGLRRLTAQISIAQTGVVILALAAPTSIALVGAVLLIVAGGLACSMLLIVCGAIEERTHTVDAGSLGGLVHQMPQMTGFLMLGMLSLLGAPLLAGFSGEVMLVTGAFAVHRYATVAVLILLVVLAVATLRAFQTAFLGPVREQWQRLGDANNWERTMLGGIAVFVVLFGALVGRVMPAIGNGVLAITTRLSGGG